MDDDQQNEPGLLLAWILGIAVTIAIVVAILSGVLGALGSSSGAPAAAAAPPAADKPVVGGAAAKLYFATGKAELPADAAAALAPLIDALKAGKARKLVISGYHDATGDPAQNAELAKQRAFAVRDALSGAGLTAEQIELSKPQETIGGGSDDREARRVEISAQP